MEEEAWSADFETHYTKEYSLRNMTTWAYVYHPDFDAYMVAIAGPNDFLWVGAPKDFDWHLLKDKALLHHNATFDGLVMRRLIELGVIPDIEFGPTYDTADLAAYLQHPRALKDFAKATWGLREDANAGKEARKKMQVTSVAELSNDPQILKYAGNDALWCRRLWLEFSEQWPENERELSRLNREAGWRGVQVDMPYVEDCVQRLQLRLFEAEQDIPWKWDAGKTPLARKKVIEQCRQTVAESRPLTDAEFEALDTLSSTADLNEELNTFLFGEERTRTLSCEVDIVAKTVDIYMWYPESFGKDDPECIAWEETYADKYPWIRALRDWRRLNMLYQKFVHLKENVDANGIYHYNKKYFGAQRTGRFSGSGGFNLENLPRDEMFTVDGVKGTGFDLRRCFVGNLAIVDFAQIEARVLLGLVKDEETLDKIRGGLSVYEAHARATMGWTGGKLKVENPEMYLLSKIRCLGCSYGVGPKRFIEVAKMFGVTMTEEESRRTVQEYRASNPKITKFWYRLNDMAHQAAHRKQPSFDVMLPSGRVLKYWSPRYRTVKREKPDGTKEISNELFSMELFNSPSSYRKTYGAKITENCISEGTLVLTDSGWKNIEKVCLSDKVHDGVDFVEHGGILSKSVQPCVEVDGVLMTKDHEVLTDEGWKAALEKPRPYRPGLRELDRNSADGKRREEDGLGVPLPLWELGRETGDARDKGAETGWDTELWMPYSTAYWARESLSRHDEAPSLLGLAEHERQVSSSNPSGVEKLWWAGNRCLSSLAGKFRKLLGRPGAHVSQRADVGAGGQFRRLHSRELCVGDSKAERKKPERLRHAELGPHAGGRKQNRTLDYVLSLGAWVGFARGLHSTAVVQQPVYDILNAGPRNRFVVQGREGPFIVHNCCQAVARDILRDAWLALDRAGYQVLFTVHDEFVIDLKDGQTLEEAERIVKTPEPWAEFIPLDVEGKVSPVFTK